MATAQALAQRSGIADDPAICIPVAHLPRPPVGRLVVLGLSNWASATRGCRSWLGNLEQT
jgi:hypothetical protein